MTFPTVSTPSRVVRSMHRIARSSAQRFASFLIERFASDAARSSRPTASTAEVCRTSRPASAGWIVAYGWICALLTMGKAS
jgi:hypothetical protein